MATIYYAQEVLLPDMTIMPQGAVAVEGDTIVAVGSRSSVGRQSGDRIVQTGNLLLMPGLINMHTHLEEEVVRGIFRQPDETFSAWLTKKNSRLKPASAAGIRHALELGVRECLAGGTTTVVDSSRTGLSGVVLQQQPIRACIINEIHESDEQTLPEVLRERTSKNVHPAGGMVGVGPYALFSLTPAGHGACQDFAAGHKIIWASHVAESAEELQAFSEQSGDLFFQITRRRSWPYGLTKRGSLHYALENDLIPHSGICFHCNYAGSQELAALAARQCSVVLCLQYNQVLGHKPFTLETALNRGVRICLGTESIADVPSISLFDELYTARQNFPHIKAATLLAWVTANPAQALRCPGRLGLLAPGAKADLIGVRFAHSAAEDALEALINEQPEVKLVVVNGEEVIVDY